MENKDQVQQEQSQRGRKSATLLLLLILLVTITVGFAVLSTTLSIKGSSTIAGGGEWCVGPHCNDQCTDAENPDCHIIECPASENCVITDCDTHPENCVKPNCTVTATETCQCTSSDQMCVPPVADCTTDPTNCIKPNCTVTATETCQCQQGDTGCIEKPQVWMKGGVVYFHHTLEKPGDVFYFTTKYTNGGTLDAEVETVTPAANNFANETARKFLTYAATYGDDTAIGVGDSLAAGVSKTYKVTVAYKSDIQALPTTAELAEINQSNETGYNGAFSSFQVTYKQK